jgi:hypothetical protein
MGLTSLIDNPWSVCAAKAEGKHDLVLILLLIIISGWH